MMKTVDGYLAEKGSPPPQRPLKAWMNISQTLKLGLEFPGPDRPSKPNIFYGEDMTLKIFEWYQDHYGKKLAMHWGLIPSVARIREEYWRVSFPKVFGAVRITVSKAKISNSAAGETTISKLEPVEHNALNSIDDIPSQLIQDLTYDELCEIGAGYTRQFVIANEISIRANVFMYREIISDFTSAVDHMTSQLPNLRQSKWCSLHATEKAMKSLLASEGIEFPNTHLLRKLSRIVEPILGVKLPEDTLALIECSPSVRYGEGDVTPEEAYLAHDAAVQVAGLCTMSIPSPIDNMLTEVYFELPSIGGGGETVTDTV